MPSSTPDHTGEMHLAPLSDDVLSRPYVLLASRFAERVWPVFVAGVLALIALRGLRVAKTPWGDAVTHSLNWIGAASALLAAVWPKPLVRISYLALATTALTARAFLLAVDTDWSADTWGPLVTAVLDIGLAIGCYLAAALAMLVHDDR